MLKIGLFFKFFMDRVFSYFKNPDNMKVFIIYWGSILFNLPTSQMSSAWDLIWELAQDAAKMFPGRGTGDSKYKYLSDKFMSAMPDMAGHIMDFILHNLLPVAEAKGVTT